MPISKKDKAKIIRALLVTKQKSHGLELDLKFAGKFVEAAAQEAKSTELSVEIDRLLGEAMDAWSGSGTTVLRDIGDANAKLQRAIREIQNDTATAQNIVKVLGLVDDVVQIALKLGS